MLELTEQAVVDDYPQQLAEALVGLRGTGVLLAVDDAAAGWSSLMHILKLAPDCIKLDRQRPMGSTSTRCSWSLAAVLPALFAGETGAVLVAEGIETAAELGTLRDLGIRFGQGYHLAHPGPMGELDAAFRARDPADVEVGTRATCPRQRPRDRAPHPPSAGRSRSRAGAAAGPRYGSRS